MFGLDPAILAVAVAITLLAGYVKGAVGFAMPMIMISGLASFLPTEQALAALIVPTLTANLVQSLRQGGLEAWRTFLGYWRLIATTCLFVAISAQFVTFIPEAWLLAGIGLPIALYALAQLAGADLRLAVRNRGRAEILTGICGGIVGGLSGVWGPPVIVLLLSLGVAKQENVRVQGTVYLTGAVALFGAHLGSGVLNAATLPLSVALIVPGLAGLWLGFRTQDRLDPARFRRWTLVLLAVTGANLLRRALML